MYINNFRTNKIFFPQSNFCLLMELILLINLQNNKKTDSAKASRETTPIANGVTNGDALSAEGELLVRCF